MGPTGTGRNCPFSTLNPQVPGSSPGGRTHKHSTQVPGPSPTGGTRRRPHGSRSPNNTLNRHIDWCSWSRCPIIGGARTDGQGPILALVSPSGGRTTLYENFCRSFSGTVVCCHHNSCTTPIGDQVIRPRCRCTLRGAYQFRTCLQRLVGVISP